MHQGIVGLGMWCVDTTYKLQKLPNRGQLEIVNDSFKCVGGGPSNVLTDLESLGFKYPKVAMGSIGRDSVAEYIKAHCKKNRIQTNYLIPSLKTPTSHTVCMYEQQKERTFLYYPGANDLIDIKHNKIGSLNFTPKILYIGYLTLLGKLDSFHKGQTRLTKVLEFANKKQILTVIDLASSSDPKFKKIVMSAIPYTNYLLMNEIEAKLLFNKNILNSNQTINKSIAIIEIKKLLSKGVQNAVVLHCSKESLYVSRDKVIVTKSPILKKNELVNSVGAGDAFCAGFIFGIHENWSLSKILTKAHAAGSAMMKIDASSGGLPNISKL